MRPGDRSATFSSVRFGNHTFHNARGDFRTKDKSLRIYERRNPGEQRHDFRIKGIYRYDIIDRKTSSTYQEKFVFIMDHDISPECEIIEILITEPKVYVRMLKWMRNCLGVRMDKLKTTIPPAILNFPLCPPRILLPAYSTTRRVTPLFTLVYALTLTQQFTSFLGVCPKEGSQSEASSLQLPRELCVIIEVGMVRDPCTLAKKNETKSLSLEGAGVLFVKSTKKLKQASNTFKFLLPLILFLVKPFAQRKVTWKYLNEQTELGLNPDPPVHQNTHRSSPIRRTSKTLKKQLVT